MQSRRVRISLEGDTDAPMSVLKKAMAYRLTLYGDGGQKYEVTVHQALADAQQAPKAAKGKKVAR